MRRSLWIVLPLAAVLWGVAIVYGFFVLIDYGHTPGANGVAITDWPSETTLVRGGNRPTIILAVHPHCPCSRASIGELAEIAGRCPGRATIHVLFCRPASFPSGWERSALWDEAAAIPGVQLHCDEEGAEARRFGALTSGQVLLFSARGELLFRGGITLSRGHAGNNAGRDAVVSFLTNATAERTTAPVFGCPLFDSNQSTFDAVR